MVASASMEGRHSRRCVFQSGPQVTDEASSVLLTHVHINPPRCKLARQTRLSRQRLILRHKTPTLGLGRNAVRSHHPYPTAQVRTIERALSSVTHLYLGVGRSMGCKGSAAPQGVDPRAYPGTPLLSSVPRDRGAGAGPRPEGGTALSPTSRVANDPAYSCRASRVQPTHN
eukprot:684766-Prorocentrum_minimum.AAC.2